MASGKIKFQGFPELEGDVVLARLLLPQGTPLSKTESVVSKIMEALEETNQHFKPQQPGEQDLIRNAYVQYNLNTEAFENGPHVATIAVDLLTAEKRSGTIDAYLAKWRSRIGSLPDVISLTLGEPGFGPGGRPIEVRLRGHDLEKMKKARKEGLPMYEAAARASRERFRAVLMTSTTTIAGLLPLLFEKSLQAQILIPLVISTSFGLMASTVLVLLVIPCMYLILGDLGIVEKIGSESGRSLQGDQKTGK